MEIFAVAIVLVVLAGSVSGIVLISRVKALNSRLDKLELQLRNAGTIGPRHSAERQAPVTPVTPVAAAKAEPEAKPETTAATAFLEPPENIAGPPARDFARSLRGVNWMVWLGGVCVAIAGIFMARYSIEQGLLGPTARITFGILTGLTLLATAEWLRRRLGETSPSFAALAGGGSITLYAVVLAGQQMYALYSPGTAFVVLALIALLTMYLAYLHGPALAAIGILGAYIVPVLVSTGQGNILFALLYSLTVSASALLLLRYVYRSWLWVGFMLGALAWWVLSLGADAADGFHGWYLAVLAYLILAVPQLDWKLQCADIALPRDRDFFKAYWSSFGASAPLGLSLLLLVVAQALSLFVTANYSLAGLSWMPLAALLLISGGRRDGLEFFPWILLVLQLLAMVLPALGFANGGLQVSHLAPEQQTDVYLFLFVSAVLFSGLALLNYTRAQRQLPWASLAVMAPVLALAVAYFLSSRFIVSWYWAAAALPIGLVYLSLAVNTVQKRDPDNLIVWLFFGGHAGLSLALVMVLRDASLTLAIALQLVSLAWIIQRFSVAGLSWIFKGLVTIVIIRLTLNPWLTSYPDDVHWSLWTFGGSTLCCVLAWRLLRPFAAIARWAEGAALHLLVLTLLAETRYWLSDGDMFGAAISSTEVALYMALAGALSVVYRIRAGASANLKRVYNLYARLLYGGAFLCYLTIATHTLESSLWVWAEIGTTPIFNLLLLFFALPVVLALLNYRVHEGRFRSAALYFAGVAGFVCVSLEITHLWQGEIRLDNGYSSGELYTYSAVWLVLAMAAMLAGLWRYGAGVYKAGLILLGLVVAKLFLWDMSGLEGLLRIASFMGLGLCLLGVAYLNQRLAPPEREA